MAAMLLLELPNEIIVKIIQASRPWDFESFVLSCRHLYTLADDFGLVDDHYEMKAESEDFTVNYWINSFSAVKRYHPNIFRALNWLVEKPMFMEYITTLNVDTAPGRDSRLDEGWSGDEDDQPGMLEDNLSAYQSGGPSREDAEDDSVEFAKFCNSRRTGGRLPYADGWIQNLSLPVFYPGDSNTAMSYWDSDQPVELIPWSSPSAVILLMLSLPNLRFVAFHNPQPHVLNALNTVLRNVRSSDRPVFPNLRRVYIPDYTSDSWLLHALLPLLAAGPVEEFYAERISDQHVLSHPSRLAWVNELAVHTLTSLSLLKAYICLGNLKQFLSALKNLRKIFLDLTTERRGWDDDRPEDYPDPNPIVKTLRDTVGNTLEDLALTFGEADVKSVLKSDQGGAFTGFPKLRNLFLDEQLFGITSARRSPNAPKLVERPLLDYLPPHVEQVIVCGHSVVDLSNGLLTNGLYRSKHRQFLPALKKVSLLQCLPQWGESVQASKDLTIQHGLEIVFEHVSVGLLTDERMIVFYDTH